MVSPSSAAIISYNDRVRAHLLTLDTETLDLFRRIGERKPEELALGGMTGQELADFCDDEIGARYVQNTPNADDSDARA